MHADGADVQREFETFWNTVALLIIEHMGDEDNAAG
jgi:hypothetical protein